MTDHGNALWLQQYMSRQSPERGYSMPSTKSYGTILAQGYAHVQNGDTYVYNFNPGITLHDRHPISQLYSGSSLRSLRQSTITTVGSRSQARLLPWLLKLTSERLEMRQNDRSDQSWFFHVDLLGTYRLNIGFRATRDLGLRIHRPSLRYLVRDDAPIMLATQKGDLIALRNLLVNRMASPTDRTQANISPLFYAIDNRHSHIVNELLLHGADPNETFGENQTTPLAWALHKRDEPTIRSLIAHGANLQHISRLGWSLLFYLWFDEEHIRPSCTTLMSLLQTADPVEFRQSHQTLVDVMGYSIVNRVACMGHPDELAMLLHDGAETTSVIALDWNAMFNATHQGILENLKVLAPFYPGFVSSRDLRGWTLLHVAASEGHDDIVRYLLEQGANWQAKSWPSFECIDESLKGRACTPAEVAWVEGCGRKERFLGIVAEFLRVDSSPLESPADEKVDLLCEKLETF